VPAAGAEGHAVSPARAITLAAAVAATLAIAPTPARADDADVLVYKVKPGDTLDLVAAEIYGDHSQVVLIVAANKMTKPRPLRPGEKLRVPRNREYVTAPGDKLPALAKTLLGDERRAWLLAGVNHLDDGAQLPAGTLLEIPLQTSHTPAGPEPLANIAQIYFGDPTQVDLIKRYNELEHDTLDKGEVIAIPMPNVKVRKLPPLDAESQARRNKAEDAERAVQIALPQAHRAWRDGDFQLVRTLLAPIELDFVDTKAAIEAGVLLGEAELAFDDADAQTAADAAFRAAVERGAPPLHAYNASPKIRAAWTKAGGTVDDK